MAFLPAGHVGPRMARAWPIDRRPARTSSRTSCGSLSRRRMFATVERSLPRERFDAFADEHKKLAIQMMEGLARKLAIRLRYANAELRYLEES